MTVETTMPLANSVEIVSSTTTNVAEAIRFIHQGETSGTTPFYNATAESVIASLKPGSIIRIATIKEQNREKPIGYALLGPPASESNNCREIGVMVSSEYRHQGFATTLFLDLLNSVRDQGITHCAATFSTSNKAVWRLLRSAEQAGLIHHVTKIYGSETEVMITLRDQQSIQLSADQRAASNLPAPPEHAAPLDS